MDELYKTYFQLARKKFPVSRFCDLLLNDKTKDNTERQRKMLKFTF